MTHPPLPEDTELEDLVQTLYWHGFNTRGAPGSTVAFEMNEYLAKFQAWHQSQTLQLLNKVEREAKKLPHTDEVGAEYLHRAFIEGLQFGLDIIREELA